MNEDYRKGYKDGWKDGYEEGKKKNNQTKLKDIIFSLVLSHIYM